MPENQIGFEVGVAGVTFEGRQSILSALYDAQAAHNAQLTADLEREPDNRYDPSAIKVMVSTAAHRVHIGYIPRNLAARLAPKLDAGEPFEIKSVRIIKGASDRGTVTYGARLYVEADRAEEVS